LALTLRAGPWPDFLVLVLNKGAQDVAAFVAVVLDDGQLGKHTGGSGHNAAGTNQLKKIYLLFQYFII